MAISFLYGTDPASESVFQDVITGLERYQAANPGAQIDVYRKDKFLINVRVIDDGFAGMHNGKRNEYFFKFFEGLDEDSVMEIYPLICLTRKEVPTSVASFAFDHPHQYEEALI